MTNAVTCTAQRHDTYSDYRQGCRCPLAREDWRLYYKRRRQGRARDLRVAGTGTHRRIQALHTLGWTGAHIAAAAGLHPKQPAMILRHPHVLTTTADAICRAYDALAMRPGPSERTRSRAVASGWLPPLAWDDDTLDDIDKKPICKFNSDRNFPVQSYPSVDAQIIDDVAVSEAMTGRKVTLTRAELTVAIETMTGMGLSAKDIADRLGLAPRSVVRNRNTDHPIRAYRKVAA